MEVCSYFLVRGPGVGCLAHKICLVFFILTVLKWDQSHSLYIDRWLSDFYFFDLPKMSYNSLNSPNPAFI